MVDKAKPTSRGPASQLQPSSRVGIAGWLQTWSGQGSTWCLWFGFEWCFLPAGHVRNITILDGCNSLELAVIPHRLLEKIINKESFDKTKNQHRVIWLNEKAKESPNLSTPGSFDDVLPEPEHWTLDHCVDRPGFEKNGLQNSLLVYLFFLAEC